MRRMSYSMTERQIRDGSKDVTRRLGWLFAKPGDRYLAVSKCMGLKPGEEARIFGAIEVLHVRREPLNMITARDVAREGYPGKSPEWFVEKFSKAMRCDADVLVTRIEFRRVGKWAPPLPPLPQGELFS